MTTMNISLPDPMREWVEAQIAKAGYGTVSEYVRALIREEQKRQAQEALEQKLLDALGEESSPLTKRDWEEIRKEVRKKMSSRRKDA